MDTTMDTNARTVGAVEVSVPEPVYVNRWPSERPLFVLVALFSLLCWVFLVVSVVGIFYASFFGLFFLVSHAVFIAHLRGSAVRLGSDQMPELHRQVKYLARRIGLRQTPDVYVMQAGGTLNAMATKFFATNFVVLYSDLLEACGDNTQARDMIIAHELGHLKAGHLRGLWFLLPGLFMPFLGQSYSRAREYTCDRYGFAVCDDRNAALLALSILAAGGSHGPKVNLQALARQGQDLDTAWMTIGRWLSTHPPIADRIAAIDPNLVAGRAPRVWGPVTAAAMLASLVLVPVIVAGALLPSIIAKARMAATQGEKPQYSAFLDGPAAGEQAWRDMREFAEMVETYRRRHERLPENIDAVYAAWASVQPGKPAPVDQFGRRYGYQVNGNEYFFWSDGPDDSTAEDDLVYSSMTHAQVAALGGS